MSYNGEIAIDLDSHIVERADRFYQDYIDPAYRPPYQALSDAVEGSVVLALRQPALRDRADRDGATPSACATRSASRGASAWRRRRSHHEHGLGHARLSVSARKACERNAWLAPSGPSAGPPRITPRHNHPRPLPSQRLGALGQD
jgi:hypothetical protein